MAIRGHAEPINGDLVLLQSLDHDMIRSDLDENCARAGDISASPGRSEVFFWL